MIVLPIKFKHFFFQEWHVNYTCMGNNGELGYMGNNGELGYMGNNGELYMYGE